MLDTRILRRGALAATGALIIAFAAAFAASDIVEDWDSVKPPPKPELKAVTLDPSTTALLILDMSKNGACRTRPRCIATIPNVKRLHDAARAAGVMLWYSIGGPSEPAEMIGPGFAPRDGEWAHQGGPDKFLGSNLEEKLKGHGVKTVVVCGTSFQGVGVGTGTEAAQRGYKVIVPVDCLSSEDTYMEQYSAWHFFKGGPAVVTGNSTLTRSTMVKFGN
jgi:nicotinamidase-related amidase